MPIPTPNSGEDQATFVARAHRALAKEIPDTEERNAVIFKTWRQHHGESEEEKVAHTRFADGQYEHLTNIPVFKEHSYARVMRDATGQVVIDEETGKPKTIIEKYDLKALQAIVKNCNERVLKTKSFAPITAIHTGKKKADGTSEDPEVLGFGGPFRLGMYGMEDRDDNEPMKGKWAIFEDEWWFKDKAHRAREKCRRSPEVYVGRPMHQRFLDPVTALGAETPALDMGIHYHRTKRGDLVERYSAESIVAYSAMPVMPGPANVAVPKPVKLKHKLSQYEEDPVQPTGVDDKAQYDDDELAELTNKVNAFHSSEAARHGQLAQEFRDKGDLKRATKHEKFAKWHAREAMPYKPKGGDEGEEGKLDISHAPAAGNELRQHMSQCLVDTMIAKYGAADPEVVNACVQAMMETQPLKWVVNQMQAAAAPVVGTMEQQIAEGEEAEEGDELSVPGDEPEEEEEDEEQEETLPVGEDTEEEAEEEEEAAGGPVATGKPEPPTKGKDKKMPDPVKPEDKEKFEISRDDWREMKAQYGQLSATIVTQGEELKALHADNVKLKREKTMGERRAAIQKLRLMGFQVDEAKEIQRCSLETMTDAAFQTHLDTIVEYGQAGQAPIGGVMLPTPGLEAPQYIADPANHAAAVEERAQYGGLSQADSEAIAQYQLRKQEEGEYLSWEESKERFLAKKDKKDKKKEKKAARVA